MRVAVLGGAGFVGSNVAVELADRHPGWSIVAFDNLRRRGSELTLPRLRAASVEFVHGDVRQASDLETLGKVDAVVECSAEPSVLAGVEGGIDYLVSTNLFGAYACLELCRRSDAALVFLSTSRVYPIGHLAGLALVEEETRFDLALEQRTPGASRRGISEEFPLNGARTPYGATKLAAETLIVEYAETFGVRAVVDRCGVIAGPWQMGKVDQGVLAFWLMAHHFGLPLRYIGFGGSGKQVRDFLHVRDLAALIDQQLAAPESWRGVVANVGGGPELSASLLELTTACSDLTGVKVRVEASSAERPGDVPYYVSDCARLFSLTDWRPATGIAEILGDTHEWIVRNEATLRDALAL